MDTVDEITPAVSSSSPYLQHSNSCTSTQLTTTTTTAASSPSHLVLHHDHDHGHHKAAPTPTPKAKAITKGKSVPISYAAGSIKKKKHRSSCVVNAANSRLRSDLPNHAAMPVNLNATSSPSLPPIPIPMPSPRNDMGPKAKHAEQKRKGLRHFAVRVCKKVEEKTVTTYNEVADELVTEERVARGAGLHGTLVDEKNIRRRVYDSLNVLMAMGILKKDKKKILWQGLSVASPEHCAQQQQQQNRNGHNGDTHLNSMHRECDNTVARIRAKKADLAELQDQLARMLALIKRREAGGSISDSGSDSHSSHSNRLNPPFIILSSAANTNIDLLMDESRHQVCFKLDARFRILDDREILKRLPFFTQSNSNHDAPPQQHQHQHHEQQQQYQIDLEQDRNQYQQQIHDDTLHHHHQHQFQQQQHPGLHQHGQFELGELG